MERRRQRMLEASPCGRKAAGPGVVVAGLLVLMLTFSFMSVIQFLGWLLLSLCLYVRGMRNKSARDMFLGSLVSACAIGTRQFGIVIIVGVVFSWLVSMRESRLPIRFI